MDSDDWQEIEQKQEASSNSELDENGQNETWTVLRSSNSGQLLREVCSSEHSIHEELFTMQDLMKIRKQLLDSFDGQFTFLAERLVNLDITSSSIALLASTFSAAAAALHEQQQTFDFTAAYILKLCADYLQKSFHLVLKDILANKDKHKKEYSNYLQEATIEIIAAGMLDDHERMEQLIAGHRVCQNSLKQTQFHHKMNAIINASDNRNEKTQENLAQQEDQSAKDFSFQALKLKLQMKCQLYLESWQGIIELLGYYNSPQYQTQLNQLKIDCENEINSKQNPLEMFVVKSVSLEIPEIMLELQKLTLNEHQKIALLARVLAFKPAISLSNKKATNQLDSQDISKDANGPLDDDSFPRLSQIEHHTTSKHKEVPTKKINCLSLDGGGIRGVVQLILLSELENKTGKKCCEMFDFFGGTSIGGIIALSLAAGYSAQTLLFKFIGTTKNHIFAQRHYMRYLLGVNPDGEESQFNYALYDKEGIETELKEFFKDMKLNELPSNVLVTSCEVKGTEMVPVVFTKLGEESGMRSIQGLHPSKNMETQFSSALLRDVARSSSAAYPFLSATVINGSAFVDGGFLFNNVDILVTNFLISQGYKKSQIKMLSLGNAPPEIASSMMGLEQGRTAALGLINCVKGLANPENYYESYIAMANLNLDHSLAETSAALGEGYIRIFPEYGGQFISLDAVDMEDVSKLKSIGSNWINACRKNGHFKEIQKNILNQFDWISNEVDDIQIIPRYYSYTEEYLGLEQAITAKEESIWRKSLLGFQFRDKQQIVEPYSLSKMLKGFFVASKIEEQAELLSKAAAIGHIPSLKYLLSALPQNQQRELILKQTHNYWNSMHYAAANGEIASFVYLLGVLFETDMFSENNSDIIPKRIRKSISSIHWEQTKQNIKDFIAEKSTTQLPYSNCYAPLFNYHRVDTLRLALENKQLQFNGVLNYLLAD